jgi:hypothetical protein
MPSPASRPVVAAVAALLAATAFAGCGDRGTTVTGETTGDGTGPATTEADFEPTLVEHSSEHLSLVGGGRGDVTTYGSPDEPEVLVEHYRAELGPEVEETTTGERTTLVVRERDGSAETAEAVSITPVEASDVEDLPASTRSVVERSWLWSPIDDEPGGDAGGG